MDRSTMVWTALWRGVVFALLWLVLTEGEWTYLRYAVLAVPVAVTGSLVWLPPTVRSDGIRKRGRLDGTAFRRGGRRMVAAVSLLAWFLAQTVRGGVDVAVRSLARPVRVDPVEVLVPVRLGGRPRAVALAVVGLMPGTITMEVGVDEAVLHTLSADLDAAATWQELERRVHAVLASE